MKWLLLPVMLSGLNACASGSAAAVRDGMTMRQADPQATSLPANIQDFRV